MKLLTYCWFYIQILVLAYKYQQNHTLDDIKNCNFYKCVLLLMAAKYSLSKVYVQHDEYVGLDQADASAALPHLRQQGQHGAGHQPLHRGSGLQQVSLNLIFS